MLRPADRDALYLEIGLAEKTCAEVGVFDGGNAKQLLACRPRTLYLIDAWRQQPSQSLNWANPTDLEFEKIYSAVRKEFAQYNNVHIVREDSCVAADQFAEHSFDFVYIDTVHERQQCLRELMAWMKKVKPGGWLCGHDYTFKFGGIVEAITEFCMQQRLTLDALTMEEGFPSFGIRIRE
jgi:hypothetical protein